MKNWRRIDAKEEEAGFSDRGGFWRFGKEGVLRTPSTNKVGSFLMQPEVPEVPKSAISNFETRKVFSPIAPGKKKIADVVARLSFRDRQACFLVHVESQSSAYTEEDFRWRMFHYFARLHEKYRLPVYPKNELSHCHLSL